MSDIGDWFRSIPAITRYWFAATVAVPLVGKLGLISPAYFFLWPEAFLYRFQVTDRRRGAAETTGPRLVPGGGGGGGAEPRGSPARAVPLGSCSCAGAAAVWGRVLCSRGAVAAEGVWS